MLGFLLKSILPLSIFLFNNWRSSEKGGNCFQGSNLRARVLVLTRNYEFRDVLRSVAKQ